MKIGRTLLTCGLALLAAAACGDSPKEPPRTTTGLVIDYPRDGSVFPPEFVPPTFLWHDDTPGARHWRIEFAFADGGEKLSRTAEGTPPPPGEIDPQAIGVNNEVYKGTEYQRSARAWTPDAETWEEIKRRSVDAEATATFRGPGDGERSRASIRITTSKDPVGAPIFYRDVPLMPAVGRKGAIKPLSSEALPLIAWRIRDVAQPESRVVLKNMPSCANCHSFSNDGKTLAMDVDGPEGDKGAYMIAPVGPEMVITDREVITWNSFPDKPEGHRTLGFLSRVSPDGGHVVSTVNESLYVTNFRDYRILQVFYPTRGILAWYSTETGEMKALPGADDPEYVHCCGVWTPDGKTLVFARARAFDPYQPGQKRATHPNDPNEPQIRYDLYRMPFNEGRGGTPVPVEGASGNGMSNAFPKVSPDGKWIVWTKCANGLLLRPDGKLWIVPVGGGEAREMNCNTTYMNSWHSFSPNGRWLVFSSKVNTPYTQMFLTHIDEDGNDTPPILIPNSTAANRAVNIPEFLNAAPDAIRSIDVPAVAHHRFYQQTNAFVKTGQFEKAVATARQALEREPDFNRARVLLGWALVKTGNLEEGVHEIREVIRLDPRNASAHRHLGLVFTETGRLEDAIRSFALAVEHGPSDQEAWKGLGHAHFELGNAPQARHAYEQALEVDPGDADAHESLAVVLMKQGEKAGAMTHLVRVCEISPNDLDTRLFLAFHAATSPDDSVRDGARAIVAAREACELTEWKLVEAIDLLGAAYAEAGRWEDAKKTVRKAIVLAEVGDRKLVPGLNARLNLYDRKQAYRHRVAEK